MASKASPPPLKRLLERFALLDRNAPGKAAPRRDLGRHRDDAPRQDASGRGSLHGHRIGRAMKVTTACGVLHRCILQTTNG